MAAAEHAQKVMDAANSPGNQGAVGIVTLITGWSTYFELLTPIIGAIAGILGGILTSLLIINSFKKGRDDRKMRKLEREAKHLEIEIKEKTLEDMSP
jgi:hypothetical protein